MRQQQMTDQHETSLGNGIEHHERSSSYLFLIIGIPAVAFLIAALPAMQARGVNLPLSSIAAGSVGLLLQSIPFVLIGVLISAAVETWMTEQFIERHFPHSKLGGFATALLAGVCMPVCDCVVVPTFARLVGKRLPLPYAVTFLCAVPVINPVAMWSTWFAFADTPWMVGARVVLGCVVALIVGLSFLLLPPSYEAVRSPTSAGQTSMLAMHHHHHEAPTAVHGHATTRATTRAMIVEYARHIHDDFLTMMPIIVFGALVASTIRTMLGSDPSSKLSFTGVLGAIVIMMVIAYASSLCSTSDAVIARSLASAFPTPALLAFLVFGPMLDLKNTLMLISQCHWRFTVRLAITITLVCLVCSYATHWVFGGAL